MQALIDVILHAGRSAVDTALYTLLPIMVVMMILMRWLEVRGVTGRLVAWLAPVARPFGLPGLGVLAMVQITLVSFAAPMPTLALMDRQGIPSRQLAATLAAMLAMAPANAMFPLAGMGMQLAPVLLMSIAGGLVAAAATYWGTGRFLDSAPHAALPALAGAEDGTSLLQIVNGSGAQAVRICISMIPMLLMSLVVVLGLQRVGGVDALNRALAPVLRVFGIDSGLLLPMVTKYLAGNTAMVGVVQEMAHQGHLRVSLIERSAGFLLHPLDLPGVALFASTGVRVGRVCLPALAGACVGVAFRAFGSVLLG
ncbi:nucleoside recognition family protein [Xylophilus rhododendri]|uniref:Nucleoside recognition family protein n=1 Tax=Xylophilus rhododendri TaxID=2697032 RepID=A0A857JB11_9BURK|nr:nucleoside recognition family protein [Xylophilus rhododendri]QHJ00240.1 nucleoside recognition family protein [Xylophilus rhododendri]